MKISARVVNITSNPNSIVKGIFDVSVIDDNDFLFILKDIRIVRSKDEKLFIAYPSKKATNRDGKEVYSSIGFPGNAKTRAMIDEVVMKEYDKSVQAFVASYNKSTGVTA